MEKPPVKIFISYSREDKLYKKEFLKFLKPMSRENIIKVWSDTNIDPGEIWEEVLLRELETTDIVILLISASFLNSDFIDEVEVNNALKRHKEGTVSIIPVLIRPSYFEKTKLASFMALPTDAKPVSEQKSRDKAWMEVIEGVEKVVNKIYKNKPSSLPQSSFDKGKNNPSPQPLNQSNVIGDRNIIIQGLEQGNININVNHRPNTNSSTAPVENSVETIFEKASKLIRKDKIEQAIDLLLGYTQKNGLSSEHNSLILQSSRFNSLEKQHNNGLIGSNHYEISLNKIKHALLSIIEDLKEE